MTNSLKSIVAILALGVVGTFAQAQPTAKIMVVDMAKLYDGYYKTKDQVAKFQGDNQKAQDMLQDLSKQFNDLVEEYKGLDAQAKNPVLSEDAAKKARSDADAKLQEVQNKQNEARSFQANAQRSLQERVKTFHDLMFEEISKSAVDIAKRKGATLLLDKSGPTLNLIPGVMYFDPAYDITDEVSKEINKDAPATPAPAAAAPSSTPTAAKTVAPSSDTPSVTFPPVK